MIKKIKLKKNVVIVNKHHERGYDNKKGVIMIEEDNGNTHYLDVTSRNDITQAVHDYIDIVDTKKTKEEVIWHNILDDKETLKSLERGKE